MRNLIISVSAATVLLLATPAAAQNSNTYKFNGVEYDLNGLKRHKQEPRTHMSSGTAILVEKFKDGGGCEKGYLGIVIAAPSADANRHRNCVRYG